MPTKKPRAKGKKGSKRWKKNISLAMSTKTPEILEKLRQASGMKLNIIDTYTYAGISSTTYYQWLVNDPELKEELELLRLNPILQATKTVVNSLKEPNSAYKYLEKHRPEEYGIKSKVEIQNDIGIGGQEQEMNEDEKAAMDLLRKARRKRIEDQAKSMKE